MFNMVTYNPTVASATPAVRVGFSPSGVKVFRAAVEALGTPEYVVIGYNAEEHKIGIQAATEETVNAIEFADRVKNDGHAYLGSARMAKWLASLMPEGKPLFNDYRVNYEAEMTDDGVLAVDLAKPIVSAEDAQPVENQLKNKRRGRQQQQQQRSSSPEVKPEAQIAAPQQA